MNMEIRKKIALAAVERLGGKPRAVRYYSEDGKEIDILSLKNVPAKGLTACSTVGLYETDIHHRHDGRDIRLELLGCGDEELWGNILSHAAFEIMDSQRAYPDCIVKNVIHPYTGETDMEHVLLCDPFLLDGRNRLELGGFDVTWLMAVPVSEAEFRFAEENGADCLTDLLEEKSAEYWNLYRPSVL